MSVESRSFHSLVSVWCGKRETTRGKSEKKARKKREKSTVPGISFEWLLRNVGCAVAIVQM